MSMTEFGVSCGFYLEEEVQSEAYTNAIWDKPASMTYSYMWDELTTDGGIYNPSQSKSSKLTHPAIRFIHRFMSFTVTGRGGASNGVVSQVDLLCLYAMHVGWTCNLGVLFGRYFHHSSMKKKGSLLGGSYVTRLARNLGVLEPVQRWTKLHEMEVMGIDIMRSIHIVDSDFRVIGQEGEAAQEPPQADEHEGGVDPEPAHVPQQPFDLEAAIHGLQQDQTQLRNDVEAIRAQNLQQQQQMDQQSRHIRWMRDAMHQFFQQGSYHIDPPPPSPGGN